MLFPPYLKFNLGIHIRTFNILWSFHLSVCKGPLLRNSRLCVVRNNLLRVIDIEEGELHEEGLLLCWLQPRLPCVRVVWAESKVAVHLVVEIIMKFYGTESLWNYHTRLIVGKQCLVDSQDYQRQVERSPTWRTLQGLQGRVPMPQTLKQENIYLVFHLAVNLTFIRTWCIDSC